MKTVKITRFFVMLTFIKCIFVMHSSYAQSKPPYASDQPMPYPKLFMIPGMNTSWHIVFEPDGNTFYFLADSSGRYEIIKHSHFENGNWSYPITTNFSGAFHIETPCISPDGSKFFFAKFAQGTNQDNLYIMDRNSSDWSEPRDLGSVINSTGFDFNPSVAANGNLYFNSDRNGRTQIYCSKWKNNQYDTPELISNINKYNPTEFFVAPDESYLIFGRYIDGNNYGDLYISFRNNDTWTKALSLGPKINSRVWEGRPYITPDGNYLFFSRGSEYSTWRIYQVDWKPLYDSLRNKAIPTGIEKSNKSIPDKFSLYQNYPNPFNPETIIGYRLPVISFVTLKVYDMLGCEVATLVNKEQAPGIYEVKFDGKNLTSGIYIYQLKTGELIQSKKMVLIK